MSQVLAIFSTFASLVVAMVLLFNSSTASSRAHETATAITTDLSVLVNNDAWKTDDPELADRVISNTAHQVISLKSAHSTSANLSLGLIGLLIISGVALHRAGRVQPQESPE